MKKYPLTIIFTLIIGIVTISDILTSDRVFSEFENRKLKGKVTFKLEKLFSGNFQKEYETYLNDQIIGRDTFIDIKSNSEKLIGKIENNNIILGKDGYLFEKFTTLDEEKLNKNIEYLNNFINSRDEEVVTMIVPNSYEIYKEKFYKYAPLVNQREKIDYIYENINGIDINLINTFLNNKEEYIYYKSDHHWTTYGAYLAYREYINLKGYEPFKLNKEKEKQVHDFLGTYHSKGRFLNSISDIISYYEIDNVKMTIEDKEYNTLYDYSKLKEKDKYSLFLRGNNGLTLIKSNLIKNNKKIIVFKDSFGNSLIPFLTENYEEIHVIDLRSFNFSVKEYIDKNNFDDIMVIYNFINFSKDSNLVKLKY